MELDAHQQAVVDSNARFLQVVGYPGTGKTLVLANRIARIIEDGVDPESIVALTFTNSSCSSLRRSIASNLDPQKTELAEKVRINTYHSFCRELVEKYPEDVGLTSEWGLTDFLDVHNLLYYPILGFNRRIKLQYGKFNEEQRSRTNKLLSDLKVYDFDQALRFGIKIINTHDFNISNLIIDEFQDCTSMQWRLVQTILNANPKANLAVAGDPNQEIFNFQENHLDHAMEKMTKAYPETKVLGLRYNYRSTKQIIETFQHVISSDGTSSPNLIPTVPDGKEPTLTIYDQTENEMKGIVELIKELCCSESKDQPNYSFDDIAILVRLNAEAQSLNEYLQQNGIPVKHELGIRGFGPRKLTSVALTLMKWSQSPRDFYLIQLLYNRYHQFISDKDFLDLAQSRISEKGPAASNFRSLTDSLISMNPKKYQHAFLTSFLPETRNQLTSCETPNEVKDTVIRAIESWKLAAGSRAKPNLVDLDRVAWSNFVSTVEQGCNDIQMEELSAEERSQSGAALNTLLKYLFARDKPSMFAQKDGKVTVSTIHSAKSNEWPVVILPSVTQFGNSTTGNAVESARRVQYVASSRARKELHFMNIGQIRPGSRNSFLKTETTAGFLNANEAMKRYPLTFKPIHAIRRLSRVIRL